MVLWNVSELWNVRALPGKLRGEDKGLRLLDITQVRGRPYSLYMNKKLDSVLVYPMAASVCVCVCVCVFKQLKRELYIL